jgi:hypothetical protein
VRGDYQLSKDERIATLKTQLAEATAMVRDLRAERDALKWERAIMNEALRILDQAGVPNVDIAISQAEDRMRKKGEIK